MICWDRVGDHLVLGVFDRSEIEWLGDHLRELGDLLDARFSEYGDSTVDEVPFPAATSNDPRLRAIRRHRSGASSWQEHEVFRSLRNSTARVLATLPHQGGVVHLRAADCVLDWMRALTDLRLTIAVSARQADPTTASRQRSRCRWLKSVVRTLEATATKPAVAVDPDLVRSVNQVRSFWI